MVNTFEKGFMEKEIKKKFNPGLLNRRAVEENYIRPTATPDLQTSVINHQAATRHIWPRKGLQDQ